MDFNQRLSEVLGAEGVITPQNVDNATVSSGWVDMRQVDRALATFLMGVMDIGVTCKIQKATDGSGTGATDLKSATALVGTDDGKLVRINVRNKEMGDTYTHIRAQCVVADGAVGAQVACLIETFNERYGPPANLAAVAQTVA